MTDPVEFAMQEVRGWKLRGAKATQGLTAADLIRFYRERADEVERKFGLTLTSRGAADAARSRRAKQGGRLTW
jgi:hypothetical protein